jgi:hypothetical protein
MVDFFAGVGGVALEEWAGGDFPFESVDLFSEPESQ